MKVIGPAALAIKFPGKRLNSIFSRALVFSTATAEECWPLTSTLSACKKETREQADICHKQLRFHWHGDQNHVLTELNWLVHWQKSMVTILAGIHGILKGLYFSIVKLGCMSVFWNRWLQKAHCLTTNLYAYCNYIVSHNTHLCGNSHVLLVSIWIASGEWRAWLSHSRPTVQVWFWIECVLW